MTDHEFLDALEARCDRAKPPTITLLLNRRTRRRMRSLCPQHFYRGEYPYLQYHYIPGVRAYVAAARDHLAQEVARTLRQ
jgi:hypothetical protein